MSPFLLRLASSVAVVAPLVACGAATDARDPAPSPPEDRGASVASPAVGDGGAPDALAACAGDADCAATDLCVDGTCRRACHDDAACAGGGACHTETDGAWCYNAPGCNPPPPAVDCPTLCYGYCR